MADQPKIEIYNSGPHTHGWTVRIGDRYQDHLCFGEMLETLVMLTVSGRIGDPAKAPYGGLLTAEEHAKRLRSYAGLPEEGEPIDAEFQVKEGQG